MRLPVGRGPLLALLLLAATAPARAQHLPAISLDAFPEVSRAQIGRALADAKAHPSNGARVGQLAMVLHAWEQYEAAAEVYASARAIDPRFDWLYLAGLVETRRAHHREAADLLAKAVRLAPQSIPARLALADALFDAGDLDGAGRQYAPLVDGPGGPHAHYGVGRVLLARGDTTGALRDLDAAVALYQEFGAAWYARGMALRNAGRLEEAKTSLARAQEFGTRWPAVEDPLMARVRGLRDDAGAHVTRGLALQKQGDVAGAIREYEAAAAADPSAAAPHVNLIALYGQQQAWARAEAHYRSVVSLGAVPAEAHFNFGICLAAQGKTVEATDAFHKTLEANPQHAAAWSSLAQLAELAGRVDEAEASYRKAAERAPNDPMIRFNIGRMLIARQQYQGAITELDPLKSTDHPDRARFLFGLATAYVLSGDVATGRKYATEARDLARSRGQGELADAIERELARLK